MIISNNREKELEPLLDCNRAEHITILLGTDCKSAPTAEFHTSLSTELAVAGRICNPCLVIC
jgi:hypothetical protein